MHCLANLTASPGDTGLTNDNQIGLAVTAGLVANNNDFFDRLEPIAVNDTNSAVYFAPTNIYPLINDTNFNGDALTITNAVATGGFVTIDAGGTNIIFTPTNTGTATITYTISDGHGGASTAEITIFVSPALLTITANADSKAYGSVKTYGSGSSA